MSGFVHLHTHTEFSLLDGLSSPKALAKEAAALGMPALAITDHGVMYGAVAFYKACKEVGIKPILGFEAYIAQRSRFGRSKEEGGTYHLVLLARDQAGYQNLLKLASIAQLEGFYYKPRIDKEVLEAHSEGVIVLSACASGEIPRLLQNGQEEEARKVMTWYRERFPDRFYIELQSHKIPELDPVYKRLIELAHEVQLPMVATNDIHYARRDQADAHDILLCIQTGKTVNEPQRMRMSDPSYYMRSAEEMARLYPHLPEALENSLRIAEACNVEIKFAPPYHLPVFPVPDGCGNSEEYLHHLCDEGLRWRYGERAGDPEVRERLEYELGIIHRMGFDDYFLIVWDLVRAAQERDIWWNVRGSGAGSIVAYTLGITCVDPLKNKLMFERFLNPGRISMPDIDMDFPDDRREELIAYTIQRYGQQNVAQIITFGTLGARAAVRDVGRAMDIPLSEVDKVARLIPNVPGKPVSLADSLEQVPELKELYDGTGYLKKLIDMAGQVEGVARHASTHAAGVVISDKPLDTYLPLNRPTKGEAAGNGEEGAVSSLNAVTQWPMEILDVMGMLKVDFLGLRTLTQMRLTCEWIERRHGRKLNLASIPYERVPDDPARDADVKKLYDLLSSGNTTGVFQVEGAGMRRVLQDMRPNQFQHIVAVLALYRPGPLEQIPTYIKRLHGEEVVEYRHPILENILGDTYGICVTGDALVFDTRTGRRLRLDAVGAEGEIALQGVDAEWRTASGRVTHWVHNGKQPVFEIRLRNGTHLKTTANHKFLTEFGWRELGDLQPGEYVATPAQLIAQAGTFDRRRLRVLAYLLAGSDLDNATAIHFVSEEPALLDAYEADLAAFEGAAGPVSPIRGGIRITVRQMEGDDPAPNGLGAWLCELGLRHVDGGRPGGVRSAEKFVPEFVFALAPEAIAGFLAALWDCEGDTGTRFWHYRTPSARLAEDVQTLLLKLGVPSRISRARADRSRGSRTSYRVTVYETGRLAGWLRPHLLTDKRAVSAEGRAEMTIGRTAFMDELDRTTTLSPQALAARFGIDRRHFSPPARARERIAAAAVAPLAESLPLPETAKRLRLRWEEIASITPAGIEDVYDVTVEGLHNFVANHIIVHNCVYQEQIMQIGVAMAGYEPGEADQIRKAVSKKKRDLMDKHKQMFTEGALKKGVSREVIEAVWGDIEFFARYGFNRAHATDYAVITGQTAYLKAHYPVEFMAALMTTERGNIEKLGILIGDARRSGFLVLRPCINRSELPFTIEDAEAGPAIRFGLGAVKNVGDDAVRTILGARRSGGAFRSLSDLADRVDLRKLNRRVLECLIQAGALDDLGGEGGRPALLATMDTLMKSSAQTHSAREVGQYLLFEMLGSTTETIVPPPHIPPIPNRKLLEWEKELLGTYISEHPLTRMESDFFRQDLISCTIADLVTAPAGRQLSVMGMIQRVRRINTKKGDMMAFVTLEGSSGTADLVLFPKTLERFKGLLLEEQIVVVSGKLDDRPDREDHPLIVDWIKSPNEMMGAAAPASRTGPAEPPATAAPPRRHAAPEEPPPVAADAPRTLPPRPAFLRPSSLREPPAGGPAVRPASPAVTTRTGPPPTPAPASLEAPPDEAAEFDVPAPPEEPPEPGVTLRLVVRRSGNPEQDYGRVASLHRVLTAQRGPDRFVLVLETVNGSRVELHFPNAWTRWSPELKRNLEGIIGPGNLTVV